MTGATLATEATPAVSSAALSRELRDIDRVMENNRRELEGMERLAAETANDPIPPGFPLDWNRRYWRGAMANQLKFLEALRRRREIIAGELEKAMERERRETEC